MTTETINGLHKCQAKNEPKEGQTKMLSVIQMPAKGTKKPWIKIKSSSVPEGGSPYRIVSVTPTGWEPDDYGNVSFNLEVEAVNGIQNPPRRDPNGGAMDADIPESKTFPIMSKEDYWRRKEEGDAERQRFIIRQHSQSMAIEVLKLKVTLNELTVEDLTPAKLTKLANYFDNDVIGAAQ